MIIAIIGAGAAGMAAALAASENKNVQVVLLERQVRVGRKLSATGNGRCNLANRNLSLSAYHGDNVIFAQYALEQYSVEDTLHWFSNMGLYTVTEPSGRVYPYSDQANSVVDVLRFALERPNIRLLTGMEVQKIRKTNTGFCLETGTEPLFCDRVIVACGGLAGTKLGGSMSGYRLLQKLGHRSTRLRPSLVQLQSDWSGCGALKGVRANCHAQILCNGDRFSESTGELQFTQYGLSGPVIFEISRDACQAPGKWSCMLDFVPQMSRSELFAALMRRKETNLPAEELLTGILHNRLGRVLIKNCSISAGTPIRMLPEEALQEICRCTKAFEISLTEPLGMDSAQVTAGGLRTEQFDPQTMQSRVVPGLYACGEVLDIDGDCGGYNLQWAWSSGRCAGYGAGKETV